MLATLQNIFSMFTHKPTSRWMMKIVNESYLFSLEQPHPHGAASPSQLLASGPSKLRATHWAILNLMHYCPSCLHKVRLPFWLTIDNQWFEAEKHLIGAAGYDEEYASDLANMLLDWNAAYSKALAESNDNEPPTDSVERVLSGTFALRGWIPYVVEYHAYVYQSYARGEAPKCSGIHSSLR